MPIALYPDPLLAQVLAAATFPQDVPDAARWADEHHYLTGKALTDAIAADRLPWDPSVQALLPFPSVLEMLASDMPWIHDAGRDGFRTACASAAIRRLVDAIAVGHSGKAADSIFIAGTIVHRVQTTNRSVLTATNMKRILVPTDFSKTSDMAPQYAISLAQALNSQLFLLHVSGNPVRISKRTSLGHSKARLRAI